ncbi:hypothetical protein TcG_10800 [Trypanosoma cruzi]|nr:hypothetical protein TcG_10800 [Trypanosoma cruzi]
MGGLSNHRNARPSTLGVCRHTVDGRAHSAADWAGECQSAARWSTRSCGVFVWKRFRRRQRRAGLLGKEREGTTDTEGITCDPQGACRPVEEWAGVASRLCGDPPLRARCPGQHQEQSPHHTEKCLSRGVCAFLFLLEFLSVESPDCGEEAHVPGIDAVLREGSCHGVGDRCHFAWDSAASWGKCGANSATSIRQRKRHHANLSGDVVVHRQQAKAERLHRREGVCGDRNSCGRLDAAARRGTGNRLWPRSVAGQSARQKHARLPAAAR